MTPKVILLPYYSVLLLSFQAILTLKIWCDNKPFRQWPEAWIWKSFDICHPKNFDLSSVHVEQGVLFIIHWCIRTQMQIFLCVSSSIFWTSTSPPFNQTQTSCGHKKMKVLPTSNLESKENSGNVDIPSWNPSPPLSIFQEKLKWSRSPWKMTIRHVSHRSTNLSSLFLN